MDKCGEVQSARNYMCTPFSPRWVCGRATPSCVASLAQVSKLCVLRGAVVCFYRLGARVVVEYVACFASFRQCHSRLEERCTPLRTPSRYLEDGVKRKAIQDSFASPLEAVRLSLVYNEQSPVTFDQ
eukprot:4927537-Amphidinium_carterae.1